MIINSNLKQISEKICTIEQQSLIDLFHFIWKINVGRWFVKTNLHPIYARIATYFRIIWALGS